MLRLIAGLLMVATSGPTFAHGGADHSGSPGWSFSPLVVLPLLLLLIVYLAGHRALGERSRVRRRGVGLFLSGWLVLSLALVSPLHEGGEQSFTLHMIEHELIMLVATLLLATSRVGGTLAWGLPASIRRALGRGAIAPLAAIWRAMTEPVTATIVQAVVLWAWHAPGLFDRTLTSPPWHVAQHLSFVVSSLAFWTAMAARGHNRPLIGAACLFITSLVEGALGALMALSKSPWYEPYAALGVTGSGLDPSIDQQLAGLIMWIPGGIVHGGTAILLLHRWLSRNARCGIEEVASS